MWGDSIKRIICTALIGVLVLGAFYIVGVKSLKTGINETITRELGRGWNLGNDLDCHMIPPGERTPQETERWWGNPPADRQLISAVKDAGFSTVRIPVSWYEHLDENGSIDQEWMNRVYEVVGYVLDERMYAVLDLHHEPWAVPTYRTAGEAEEQLIRLWAQIAATFKDCDDRLLFECLNEPRLAGTPEEWGTGTPEAWSVINRWNQAFVDTVRGAGGFNETRYLLVPTYGNSVGKEALNGFVLPQGERLIATVHAYVPPDFALPGERTHWNAENPDDTRDIDAAMKNLEERFIQNGIPVIIGEFGAADKGNEEDRAEWTSYFVRQAEKRNIACIWWDDGVGESSFALLDRRTLEWKNPVLLQALGLRESVWNEVKQP